MKSAHIPGRGLRAWPRRRKEGAWYRVPEYGTGRGLIPLPTLALWLLVWLLNCYEFLVTF